MILYKLQLQLISIIVIVVLLSYGLAAPIFARFERGSVPKGASSPTLTESTSGSWDQGLEVSVMKNAGISSSIVWSADFETGDLSQWKINNPFLPAEADSGNCFRPPNGVSTEQAHSGQYSMKMTIDATVESGCRQFRQPEPATGQSYYYSAWYYIPELVRVDGFWNIFQFKSKTNGNPSDVFWKLEVRNSLGELMRIVPIWKGPVPGPHEGDGINAIQYHQGLTTVPVSQWFHLEVYLNQSEAYDGHIIVWQDGIEILNEQNVKTSYEGGVQSWSVNNYGLDITPAPNTLYIDDVVISSERVSSVRRYLYLPMVLK